jgi:hypothetical protein
LRLKVVPVVLPFESIDNLNQNLIYLNYKYALCESLKKGVIMKKHIALIMGLLVGTPIIVKAKGPDRHINKVYVHEGNFSRKIILHFTSDPVVAYAPRTVDETTKREGGLLKMTFNLPSQE